MRKIAVLLMVILSVVAVASVAGASANGDINPLAMMRYTSR